MIQNYLSLIGCFSHCRVAAVLAGLLVSVPPLMPPAAASQARPPARFKAGETARAVLASLEQGGAVPRATGLCAAGAKRLPAPAQQVATASRRGGRASAFESAGELGRPAPRDVDLLSPEWARWLKRPGGARVAEDAMAVPRVLDSLTPPWHGASAADSLAQLADTRAMRRRATTFSPAVGRDPPGGADLSPVDATCAVTGRTPAGAGAPTKALPWSAPTVLADPSQTHDQYVSLAAHPTNGNLYAVFESYDLGSTDRDIHIARSTDGGLGWSVWEMPSFSLDEYMADLAIDAGGYLHVTWVRADGVIVRARSSGADNPLTWAWVRGLSTGTYAATPSIAASGAGDFGRMFIAASVVDLGEWTLLWMYSTNGGATIAYDFYYADGYPDLWPDVAIDGATVYMVNGEQNGYTGEVEILIAADAISGSFGDVANLSAWTSNNCGFPSLAAFGQNVYCVYQLDYDDGYGNVDGDIIYHFSWDGLSSVYGPYAIAADERESLGPALFARGAVVGCLYLDAPSGGDEFRLAANQAGGYGHPDAWLESEVVNDLFRVAPSFRSCAGAAVLGGVGGTNRLHAAWIDRRDYPTQGLNVYNSRRTLLPNLAPLVLEGWSGALVASLQRGVRTSDATLAAGDTTWVSFAFWNGGLAATTQDIVLRLLRDGQPAGEWVLPGGLPTSTYATLEDHPLVLNAGPHVLALAIDPLGAILEEDEDDNACDLEIYCVHGGPVLRLSPAFLHRHCDGGVEPRPPAPPPLSLQYGLPVISRALQEASEGAASGERLPVIIEPAERVDVPALVARLHAGAAGKAASRQTIVMALKGHAEKARDELVTAHRDLIARGWLDEPTALWLPGVLAARVTPPALPLLAADPRVGRLWLDDRPCLPLWDAAAEAAPRPTSLPAEKAVAWHLTKIGAPQAWAQGLDGSGVIVGHLDTGVAYDHPDLAGRMWDGGSTYPHHGYDYVAEDNDPYDGDTQYWHGTHTAGLVVGDGDGGTTTGAAPGARLMAIRCVPGYYQDIVEALQFAVERGAQVLTFSAGWGDPSPELRAANRSNAATLLAAGILWFCAAGNGDNAGGHYPLPRDIATPGDCPEPSFGTGGHTAVMAVGATDAADLVWAYSGRGPTAWGLASPPGYGDYPYPPGLIKPDLAAPGVDVTSTIGAAGYAAYSGTSMATPLVAAAAAILLQARPSLAPPELATALAAGSFDLGTPGRDNSTGAGRISIPEALLSLPDAAVEYFWVHNDGLLPLRVSNVDADVAWLTASPTTATVAPGDSTRFGTIFDPSGLPAGVHYGRIRLTSDDPATPHFLPISLAIGDVTSVADDDGGDTGPVRPRVTLRGAPNPFNPRTVLQFAATRSGRAQLDIFDLSGRHVRALLDRDIPAGEYEVVWDGRDERGRDLPGGVYLARLIDPEAVRAVRKLSLVR